MKKALQKRYIKNMDVEVTFLGFGALEIGRDWGIGSEQENKRPNESESEVILNTVLDVGINVIDTASAYHRSEERIGKFLSNRRAEYILASKCGEHNDEPGTYYDFSYQAVKQSIDNSLKLLNTNVIDIMQIHFGPNPEKVIADGETVQAMKDAKREGKIRFLGASAGGHVAKHCIESGDFDVMQMDYSLLHLDNEDNIQLCKEKGIGVFIRGGLAKGKLTSHVLPLLNGDFPQSERIKALLQLVGGNGDELAHLAMQFLYQNDGIHSILVGTKKPKRIHQNIEMLEHQIDPEVLQKAVEIAHSV
jgi:aryl-alcohol dehydrogenase-like predicted oxidoreductase